jgi:LCP family protein required for cell wall assembly
METNGNSEMPANNAEPGNTGGEGEPEKKSHRILLWTGIILLLLCLLGVGGSAVAWNRLSRNTQNTPLVEVGETAETASPQPLGTAQPAVCGRSDQQIILLLAYDKKLSFPYGSDGVRLLKVDYADQRIELLALPRGLWIIAPQQVQPDLQAASLGELYQYGLDHGGGDITQARSEAAHLIAQALFDNFTVVSNNYAVLETETFAQIVDSLGGIDVTLPGAVTLDGQTYNAGAQHWDGATTLKYVRALPAGEDDWDRFDRQDLVLSAIKSSAKASSALSQLPQLVADLQYGLTTDLNVTDMAAISCLAGQVPSGQVEAKSLPTELVSQGPGLYLIPNYEAMTAYLQLWMFGR